ncbi:MAG: DUF1587 domain-containing protein [Myxococcota bacterium]
MRVRSIGALLTVAGLVGCYDGKQGSAAGQSGTESAGDDGDGGSGDESGGEGACIPDGDSERATLRRLTRHEYNNTVRDLLGDTTLPANAFPSEELGNGFGNDANAQSVSSLLAEQYNAVAEGVATRATESTAKLAALAPCAGDIVDSSDAATVDACETSVACLFLNHSSFGEVSVARVFLSWCLLHSALGFLPLLLPPVSQSSASRLLSLLFPLVLQRRLHVVIQSTSHVSLRLIAWRFG